MTDTKSLQFRKLLVALDMTYSDQLLLQYVNFLVQKVPGVEEVVFFHNMWFDDPWKAQDILNSIDQPLDKLLEEKIADLLPASIRSLKHQIHIGQHEDSAEAIVKLQKNEQVDLTIFGKKVSYEGSGYLIERVIYSQSHSHLLVVPENAYYRMDNILVPTDFSKKSATTLLKTMHFAQAVGASVTCQHVFSVPTIYFPYIPVKDLKEKYRKKSEAHWEKFRERYFGEQPAPEVSLSFQSERTVPQMIYDFALKSRTDLIALTLDPSFLSNKLIRLLKQNIHFPLLVLKKS
jgi:nucleotide-binding universal stress UspA family protein